MFDRLPSSRLVVLRCTALVDSRLNPCLPLGLRSYCSPSARTKVITLETRALSSQIWN